MVLSPEYYAAAVAFPVVITTLLANSDAAVQNVYEIATSDYPMVAAIESISLAGFAFEFDRDFVYFELGYIGAVFGTLFWLMSYNLQKMYGVDKVIVSIRSSWLGWFLTPG